MIMVVERRYELRQQLNNNQSLDRTGLRTSINRLTNDIQKRLTELRSETVDQVCHDITSTHDSRQMFEAVRHLQKSKPSQNSIGVHDESGCLIASDDVKASVVRDYLEEQLTGDEQPLEPFEGVPRPLNQPFTGGEIHAATKSLKNGRANGPDGIPNELIKYSTSAVHEHYASIINRCFETHTFLEPIGQANIYRYHRSLAGGILYCTRARVQYIISPRGRQPEAEIFSYSTEGPTGPSAIR